MIRQLLGIDCTEEEERIAAACVLLQAKGEDIALDPDIRAGVLLALQAMRELPAPWRKEMALEALEIDPWRVGT